MVAEAVRRQAESEPAGGQERPKDSPDNLRDLEQRRHSGEKTRLQDQPTTLRRSRGGPQEVDFRGTRETTPAVVDPSNQSRRGSSGSASEVPVKKPGLGPMAQQGDRPRRSRG